MRLSKLARCAVLIPALLTASPTPAAPSFVPPTDGDLNYLYLAAQNSVFGGDYCDGVRQKPYVAAATDYVTALHDWLQLAINDQLAHAKSIAETQKLSRDRAAEAKGIVELQNALLEMAQFFSGLASVTGALKTLAEAVTPAAIQAMTPSARVEFAKSVGEKLLAAKGALDESQSFAENTIATLKHQSPITQDKSALTMTQQELAAKIDAQVPVEIKSLEDVQTDIGRIKDLIGSVNSGVDILADPNLTNLSGPLIAIGAAIAKYQQQKLLAEVNEMRKLADASNAPYAQSMEDYRRLLARQRAADLAKKALSKIEFSTTPCECPADPKAPMGLAFGGKPYPTPGLTYGAALPLFNTATTERYANELDRNHRLSEGQAKKDMAKLTLAGGKTRYTLGETVSFAIHAAKVCYPAHLLVAGPNRFQHKTGPFTAESTDSVSPTAAGHYWGELYEPDPGKADEYVRGFGTVAFDVIDKPKPPPVKTGAPVNHKPPSKKACVKGPGLVGAVENVACQDRNS